MLDLDPELGQDLSAEHLALARTRAIARAAMVPCGQWRPPARSGAGHLGLLVLDGLLARNINLLGRVSMELLGAEDLLRPWEDDDDLGLSSVSHSVTWTVHEPLRMAVLDRGFAERIAPWPEIGAALIGRAVRRSRCSTGISRSSRTPASKPAPCSSSGTWPTAGGGWSRRRLSPAARHAPHARSPRARTAAVDHAGGRAKLAPRRAQPHAGRNVGPARRAARGDSARGSEHTRRCDRCYRGA